MFKKLKDKIAEDLKFSPQRIQQLTQTVTDRLGGSGPSDDNNLFSIADDDNAISNMDNMNSEMFTDVSLQRSPGMESKSRRLSSSSMASDVSFLPRYEPPSNMYHMQSDLDVSASEFEDTSSTSSQLGQISKEQVYAAFRKAQMRYHKYRGRYTDLANHYKILERENGKIKSVLVETQDKAIRRANELKEQCTLEQKAKEHLENVLRVDIDEKQMKIDTLETKIKYLQTEENNGEKMQELKAGLIVLSSREVEYKQKINDLDNNLKERMKEIEENNLKIAKTKMELHSEINNKDIEINQLKGEIDKSEGGKKLENLQLQNGKLIEKIETLSSKLLNYESDLIKLERKEIEINNLNVLINEVKEENSKLKEEIIAINLKNEDELKSVRNETKNSLLSLENKIASKLQEEFDYKEEELKKDFNRRIEDIQSSGNLEKELIEAQDDLKSIKSINEILIIDLEQFKLKYFDLERNHLELIDENGERIKKESELEKEIEKYLGEIKMLSGELMKEKDVKMSQNGEIKRLSEEIEKLKEINDEITLNIEEKDLKYVEEVKTLLNEVEINKNEVEKNKSEFEMNKIEVEKKKIDVENLQRENGSLRDENLSLKNENDLIKRSKNDENELIKRLKGEIIELKRINDNITSNLGENDLKHIEEVKTLLNELEINKSELDRCQIYKNEVESYKNDVEKNKNDVEKNKIEVENLQRENGSLRDENLSLKNENDLIKRSKNDENELIKGLNEEIAMLKEVNNSITSKLQENELKHTGEVKIFENEIKTLLNELKINKEGGNELIKSLKGEIVELKRINDNITSNLGENDLKHIEEIKTLLNELEINKSELERCQIYKNEVESYKNDVVKNKIEVENLQRENGSLRDENLSLKNENEDVKRSKIDENELIKGLNEEIARLKEINTKITSNLDENKSKHLDYEDQINILQGELKLVQNESKELIVSREKIDKQKCEVLNENKKLKQDNLDLKINLEGLKTFEEDNRKLIDDIETTRSKLTELLNENQKIQDELNKLKHLEKVSKDHIDKYENLTDEHNRLNQENVELIKRNQQLSGDYQLIVQENEHNLIELGELKLKYDELILKIDDFDRLDLTITKLNKELLEANLKLSRLDKEKQVLENRNASDENKLKQFVTDKETHETLEKNFKTTKIELSDLIKNHEETLREKKTLENQFHELEKHYNEITHEKQLLLDEIVELKTIPINKNNDSDNLKRKLDEYKSIDKANRASIEFYENELEKLKNKNDKLGRKLDETLVGLPKLSGNDFGDSTAILEYLRNIIFNYMTGKESLVLAKVIAAVCKFDKDQTELVLQREQQKQSLLGQFFTS